MNFVKISGKKTTTKTGKTRDTWCVTSEVEYFDWLKKEPVIQVPSTERTIYSKVVVQCGCHSFPKRVKNLFCTVQYRCIFVLVTWTLLCAIWTLPGKLYNTYPSCISYGPGVSFQMGKHEAYNFSCRVSTCHHVSIVG